MRDGRRIFIVMLVVAAIAAFLYWRINIVQPDQKPLTLAVKDNTAVTVDDTAVPVGTHPWGLAFDAKGNIWQALPGCDPNPRCAQNDPPGKIAVYDPVKAKWIASYTLPADYGQELFLAFDQKGRVWFPLFASNSLGMFDPVKATFQRWVVPTPKSGPWSIVVDHKGYIWFTEHYLNSIVRFDPTNQTFQEIATPTLKSQPYGITVDAKDNIWFTENNKLVALIGEYTAQGQLLEYKIPYASSGRVTPHMIIIAPDGNIWWSEGSAGRIARLLVSQAKPGTSNGVSEYVYDKKCITCGTHTSGIAIDNAGNIWFDDSLQSIFGYFPLNGQGQFTLYNTPSSFSHPHDGFRFDANNRLWISEEGKNRLALAQTLKTHLA